MKVSAQLKVMCRCSCDLFETFSFPVSVYITTNVYNKFAALFNVSTCSLFKLFFDSFRFLVFSCAFLSLHVFPHCTHHSLILCRLSTFEV